LSTVININKIEELIYNHVINDDLNNNDLVQIIELCGKFLNLKTITDYAKENNLSYNGVKNYRNIKLLFNVKFVIDNL